VGTVLDLLRSDDRIAGWLKELESAGDPPDAGSALPAADDLPDLLLDLAVPHEDINPLVALWPAVTGDREWRWLLVRCVRALVRDMGAIGAGSGLPVLPPLPDRQEPVGRYFHVYVFAVALPYVRAYHRERGVPAEVSRRTLADLGRNMAVHRRRRGTGGLLVPWWIRLHFRGEIYQLGRLQFQRARLGERIGRAVAAAGLPPGPGDPCLAVHIPDFHGPLTPEACEDSLTRAREFFPRHFPEETCTVATCHSWLLDPQLGEYLPEDSNIIRFQRRFRLAPQVAEADDIAPVGFVFGDPDLPVDALPRRTSLERVIGDHLRAGRHWYGGSGWFRL
jgi:hypothetical protein